MELLRVVDKNGNFTGEIFDREYIHDNNLLHNEVSVFILNSNKEILLQKRSMTKRFNPGKWGLCSGHVSYDETLEDAALREIKEEIGLDIGLGDLNPIGDKLVPLYDKGAHITYHYYIKVDKSSDEFIIQKEELSEVKWFLIDDILKMIKSEDNSITLKENRVDLLESLKRI